MTVSHLSILESQEHDCLRLRLSGELDIASSPLLDAHLSELRLSELHPGGLAVRLDLSTLEFIDSAGLHALIRAIDSANGDGWRLQIDRQMNPKVIRVFKILQFEHLIRGYDSAVR